jgi:hypothetical protein
VKRHDPVELLKLVEELAPAPARTWPKTPPRKTRELPPRSLEEVQAGLAAIPPRPGAGSGTYPKYRAILWGLRHALERAGVPDPLEESIRMMEAHSPEGWNVRQVAESGGEKVTERSFWYWCKHHGYNLSLNGDEATPATPDDGDKPDVIETLRKAANTTYAANPDDPLSDLAIRLGVAVDAVHPSVFLREDTLLRHITLAYERATGVIEPPIMGGQVVAIEMEPWTVAGLLQRGGINLWYCEEKVGKTRLALAVAAAALYCLEFCGLRVEKPATGLLVLGPDMAREHWVRALHACGLATATGRVAEQVKSIWHRSTGWRADAEGYREIEQACAACPGALLVVDSLAAVAATIGLDENKSEIVTVQNRLGRIVAAHDCTLLLIHHVTKDARTSKTTGGGATRGSSAIPAAADWLVQLSRVGEDFRDTRRRVHTHGRDWGGGNQLDLVVALDEATGAYYRVGDYGDIRRQEDAGRALDAVGPLQEQLLELLGQYLGWATTTELREALGEDAPEKRTLQDSLHGLRKKRLVEEKKGRGVATSWRLTDAARQVAHVGVPETPLQLPPGPVERAG